MGVVYSVWCCGKFSPSCWILRPLRCAGTAGAQGGLAISWMAFLQPAEELHPFSQIYVADSLLIHLHSLPSLLFVSCAASVSS